MLISFSVLGQKTDSNLSPEQLKLRTELESDSSIIKTACGLFTEIDLKQSSAQQELEVQKEAIKVRKTLFKASKTNNETIKAKIFCSTDEGGTVVYYLIIDKGKIKYICDYSRDPFGGFTINSYDCEKFLIGYFIPNKEKMGLEFIPFKENENIGNKIAVLKCQSGNRDLFF